MNRKWYPLQALQWNDGPYSITSWTVSHQEMQFFAQVGEHFLLLSLHPSSLFLFLPPCPHALTLPQGSLLHWVSYAAQHKGRVRGNLSSSRVPNHLKLCRSKLTLLASPRSWQTASAGHGVLVLRSLSKIYDLLNGLLPFALAQISPLHQCWSCLVLSTLQ